MRIVYLILLLFITTVATAQNRPTTEDEKPVHKIIRFYPNPAVSVINFDFHKDIEKSAFNFQIYNFLGKKVYEQSNITPKTTVNLTDFYRGVYIFQLRDRNGKILDSGKFQVSK